MLANCYCAGVDKILLCFHIVLPIRVDEVVLHRLLVEVGVLGELELDQLRALPLLVDLAGRTEHFLYNLLNCHKTNLKTNIRGNNIVIIIIGYYGMGLINVMDK